MQGLPNLNTALRLVVFLISTNCFETEIVTKNQSAPAKTNSKGANI